jgi:archaellum component FlaC
MLINLSKFASSTRFDGKTIAQQVDDIMTAIKLIENDFLAREKEIVRQANMTIALIANATNAINIRAIRSRFSEISKLLSEIIKLNSTQHQNSSSNATCDLINQSLNTLQCFVKEHFDRQCKAFINSTLISTIKASLVVLKTANLLILNRMQEKQINSVTNSMNEIIEDYSNYFWFAFNAIIKENAYINELNGFKKKLSCSAEIITTSTSSTTVNFSIDIRVQSREIKFVG